MASVPRACYLHAMKSGKYGKGKKKKGSKPKGSKRKRK